MSTCPVCNGTGESQGRGQKHPCVCLPGKLRKANDRLRSLLAAWDHDRVDNTMRAGLVVVNEFNALRKELEADQ